MFFINMYIFFQRGFHGKQIPFNGGGDREKIKDDERIYGIKGIT